MIAVSSELRAQLGTLARDARPLGPDGRIVLPLPDIAPSCS